MTSQLTNSILMVLPDTFGYNTETSATNTFQNRVNDDIGAIRKKALNEFNNMVDVLTKNGVNVYVIGNDSETDLPDAVFPNNWFATYEDGTVILFPMLSEIRRKERDMEIIGSTFKPAGFKTGKLIDLTNYENSNQILEGTGSIVLDRKNNAAYAAESERTSRRLFDIYCSEMDIPYNNQLFFHADDETGKPIYHTNVIMSIGDGFAVICAECISVRDERNDILDRLSDLRFEVIEISYSQMNNFCGNILNVKSNSGESLIVMSERAFKAFEPAQLKILEKYGRIIPVNISTIEDIGGGSARCMMAEIFLPLE